jgi:hypothetical protein
MVGCWFDSRLDLPLAELRQTSKLISAGHKQSERRQRRSR